MAKNKLRRADASDRGERSLAQTSAYSEMIEALKKDVRARLVRLVSVMIAPLCGVGAMELARRTTGAGEYNLYLLVPTLIATGAAPILIFRNGFARARSVSERLAVVDDIAAIGPLAEALQFGENPEIYAPARDALIRLLPKITVETHLTSGQRACLRMAARPGSQLNYDVIGSLFAADTPHSDLQIAIIAALTAIGNAEDLEVVKQLAMPRRTVPERVTEAARLALPDLEARVAAATSIDTLLRAASADGDSTLLRASLEQNVCTDTLLHASCAPGSQPMSGHIINPPDPLLRTATSYPDVCAPVDLVSACVSTQEEGMAR